MAVAVKVISVQPLVIWSVISGQVGSNVGWNKLSDVNPLGLLRTSSVSLTLTLTSLSMSYGLLTGAGIIPLGLFSTSSVTSKFTSVVASLPVSPSWFPQ